MVDDPLYSGRQFLQPFLLGFGSRSCRLLQPLSLGMVSPDVFPNQIRVGQLRLQGRQDPFFDVLTGDRAVVGTIAPLPETGTAQAVVAHHRVAGSANTAFDKAGQQMVRLPRMAGMLVSLCLLHGAGLCERRVVDDPKVWSVGRQPFAFRVGARYSLAGSRVLDEALPVPDDMPNVEPVLKYSVLSAAAAVDCTSIPFAAAGSCYAFAVQGGGDLAGRTPSDVICEDTADDSGLAFVDFQFAAFAIYQVVAE
nr:MULTISPECIES: hypothetical protein [unclassified Haematospirillum]